MVDEPPVYIVDDEPEMCRSLSLLLATDGIPARCFASADLFADSLDFLEPGVIVSDVIMPGLSGIDLLRLLPQRGRSDPVVIIAGHADIPLAVEALKCGACDFIEKPFEADVILDAVTCARERLALSSSAGTLDLLSRRERQVLEAIVAGLTSKEAARKLGISPRTVETYRASLMTKTGANSVPHLVRLSIEAGLTCPP